MTNEQSEGDRDHVMGGVDAFMQNLRGLSFYFPSDIVNGAITTPTSK